MALSLTSNPMKNILTVFLLSISCLVLDAQSVTISSESAPVEYYRMPDYPLPADYSTYSANIDVSFTDLAKSGFTESYLIDQYLQLEGYKEVSKKADVEITATIGEFIIWSELRNTNKTKSKDKEGVEHKLPFDAIDTAKLVLTDKLIAATVPLSVEGADEMEEEGQD